MLSCTKDFGVNLLDNWTLADTRDINTPLANSPLGKELDQRFSETSRL